MFHNVRCTVIGFRSSFESDVKHLVRVVGSDFQQPGSAFVVFEKQAVGIHLFHEFFLYQGKPMVAFACFKSCFGVTGG